ncbi:MAG: dipeptidase, partial [Alphaproteobacteria bacterium]
PRLHEANMTLTVMGIVSKTPVGQNFDANPSDSDQLIPLTILNGWPRPTWSSIKARALHQGANLQAYADNSGGEIVFVKSKADLRELLRRRTAGEKVTGTLLALEGMQPIENDLANLDDLFAAGVRMGGLSHFFDNEVAGSAHGVDKYGLTELGRATVARMEELGIVIDIAHASPKAVDDILATATRPFVVSHTGVKATCPGNRNLSDDHLRGIAAHGSVIGISFFAGAVCDASPKGIAKAVAHAVAVAGEDHVSLGSDFDGAVATPFDVTGMPMLVDAMRAEGLSDPVIAKVLGANALRVFMAVLPE